MKLIRGITLVFLTILALAVFAFSAPKPATPLRTDNVNVASAEAAPTAQTVRVTPETAILAVRDVASAVTAKEIAILDPVYKHQAGYATPNFKSVILDRQSKPPSNNTEGDVSTATVLRC